MKMNEQEYNRIMGFSSIDYGSKNNIKKDVIRMAKKLGYKTAGFHKMGVRQLRAISGTLKIKLWE